MKSFLVAALTTLIAASPAFALNVKEGDVVNKIREVTLQSVRLGSGPAVILADARGLSLYTFDRDTAGHSNCSGSCLTVWPALHAPEGTIPAPFGRIPGNDGKPQLTLNGLPLYFFASDQAPGDVLGDYPQWHPVTVVK